MSDDDMPDNDDSDETAPTRQAAPVAIRRVDRSAPFRRLERELDPRDLAIAQRVYAALKDDEESRDEDLQRAVVQSIDRQSSTVHSLTEQVRVVAGKQEKQSVAIHDLKRTSGTASRIVWMAVAGALAFAGYVAEKIWSRSEADTTIRLELQYQREAIKRLEHALAPDKDRQ